jgi:hypothetical protein
VLLQHSTSFIQTIRSLLLNIFLSPLCFYSTLAMAFTIIIRASGSVCLAVSSSLLRICIHADACV